MSDPSDRSRPGTDGAPPDRSGPTALQDLGWRDPPPVPAYPGEDLDWDRIETGNGAVLVARDPDDPAAWMAMTRSPASDGDGRNP